MPTTTPPPSPSDAHYVVPRNTKPHHATLRRTAQRFATPRKQPTNHTTTHTHTHTPTKHVNQTATRHQPRRQRNCETHAQRFQRFRFRHHSQTFQPLIGQAAAETERAPCLDFLGDLKNADAPRVLCKISGSMVSHCLPQAYAKRGARPNKPPTLDFFGSLKNTYAPRVL